MSPTVRVLIALAVLTAPALASIASPPSGAQFGLSLGGVVNIKLKNAGGCTYDLLAESSPPGVVALTPAMGTDLKKQVVSIEAIGVGSTTVTIMTMNGTCPIATHTYGVTVDADWKALSKDFDKLAKAEFKEFRLDAGLSFKDYKAELSGLNLQYKDGTLDDEGLQDGFHLAAVDLRRSWQLSAALSYADVIGGGTQILADADADPDDAPVGFFAGGCGTFDWYQDAVCSEFAGFHDDFDRASKKGIKAFGKSGAPPLGQWNTLPPLVSAGPLFPVQAGAVSMPMTLTGPLTITTLPARNEAGDDGRLLVSGIGYTPLSGQLEVSLTWEVVGQVPVTLMQTPAIVGDEWSATFEDLMPGTYTLGTRYTGDEGAVELPVGILRTTFSF